MNIFYSFASDFIKNIESTNFNNKRKILSHMNIQCTIKINSY